MSIEVHATYRAGAIHPTQPIDLPENTPVSVTVVPLPAAGDLATDLRELRRKIVASGVPLLSEDQLDRERADRRGEKPSAE